MGETNQATKANISMAPGRGLKKVNMAKVVKLRSGTSVEMAAKLSATCLFNGGADSPKALGACMHQGQSVGVFTAMVRTARSDKANNRHIRTTQWYRGVRVVGAEVIVHVNKAGEIYRINGDYLPQLDIDVQPAIDKKTALATGMKRQQGGRDLKVEQEPILVIYAKRLAYHYVISHKGKGAGQWHYYVDTISGDTLFRYNNLQTE